MSVDDQRSYLCRTPSLIYIVFVCIAHDMNGTLTECLYVKMFIAHKNRCFPHTLMYIFVSKIIIIAHKTAITTTKVVRSLRTPTNVGKQQRKNRKKKNDQICKVEWEMIIYTMLITFYFLYILCSYEYFYPGNFMPAACCMCGRMYVFKGTM